MTEPLITLTLPLSDVVRADRRSMGNTGWSICISCGQEGRTQDAPYGFRHGFSNHSNDLVHGPVCPVGGLLTEGGELKSELAT